MNKENAAMDMDKAFEKKQRDIKKYRELKKETDGLYDITWKKGGGDE